ncbi:unnamed protein product [Schistocephalus solidus]|uniref:Protein kinase domain-containing protein n=1 Tax=Schistocephalus solidus TaxID=70667 RepID=A0A183TTC0_SCHSO|nr:unnamed protein product [Schistocephalus solidus]
MKFLAENRLLLELQLSFKQNHSCLSSLFLSTEQWTRELDEDGMVDVIFTDFKKADNFQNFWVLTLLKLSSVLMAFMDSESCAGLHAEGNIASSADLNRLISQSTANSHSPTYLLVQNTGSVTLIGDVLHRAPVLTRPGPEL